MAAPDYGSYNIARGVARRSFDATPEEVRRASALDGKGRLVRPPGSAVVES